MEMEIQSSRSLKTKRRVVKSISDRIKNRFNVSIAEVGANNVWNLATIGVVCVSNDKSRSNEILSNVVNQIQFMNMPIILLDFSTEIISGTW